MLLLPPVVRSPGEFSDAWMNDWKEGKKRNEGTRKCEIVVKKEKTVQGLENFFKKLSIFFLSENQFYFAYPFHSFF